MEIPAVKLGSSPKTTRHKVSTSFHEEGGFGYAIANEKFGNRDFKIHRSGSFKGCHEPHNFCSTPSKKQEKTTRSR